MKYKILLSILIISLLSKKAEAQPDFNYWNEAGYFKLMAGSVSPGTNFGSTSSNGLFADNGFQIGLDLNYIVKYGLGLGFKLEYNSFSFNSDAFSSHAQPQSIRVKGGFNSTKYGLNFLLNAPVIMGSENFVVNFFAEGTAGLRTMNIPEIDLTYNEIFNKYVEVSYRPRSNIMGFLGYRGGIQLLFSNKYGASFSYNAVLPSRHSIKYSSRRFDAQGRLYEDENYLHDFLDHTGFQVGFMFIMGKD